MASDAEILITANATQAVAEYKKLEEKIAQLEAAIQKKADTSKKTHEEEKQAAREQAQLEKEAARIRDENMSAYDRHMAQVEKLDRMLQSKMISEKAYWAEHKKSSDALGAANRADGSLGSNISSWQNDLSGPGKEAEEATRKAREELEKYAEAINKAHAVEDPFEKHEASLKKLDAALQAELTDQQTYNAALEAESAALVKSSGAGDLLAEKLKAITDAEKKASDEAERLNAAAKKITEENVEPLDRYKAKVDELDDLYAKGKISAELYDAALEKESQALVKASGAGDKLAGVLHKVEDAEKKETQAANEAKKIREGLMTTDQKYAAEKERVRKLVDAEKLSVEDAGRHLTIYARRLRDAEKASDGLGRVVDVVSSANTRFLGTIGVVVSAVTGATTVVGTYTDAWRSHREELENVAAAQSKLNETIRTAPGITAEEAPRARELAQSLPHLPDANAAGVVRSIFDQAPNLPFEQKAAIAQKVATLAPAFATASADGTVDSTALEELAGSVGLMGNIVPDKSADDLTDLLVAARREAGTSADSLNRDAVKRVLTLGKGGGIDPETALAIALQGINAGFGSDEISTMMAAVKPGENFMDLVRNPKKAGKRFGGKNAALLQLMDADVIEATAARLREAQQGNVATDAASAAKVFDPINADRLQTADQNENTLRDRAAAASRRAASWDKSRSTIQNPGVRYATHGMEAADSFMHFSSDALGPMVPQSVKETAAPVSAAFAGQMMGYLARLVTAAEQKDHRPQKVEITNMPIGENPVMALGNR